MTMNWNGICFGHMQNTFQRILIALTGVLLFNGNAAAQAPARPVTTAPTTPPCFNKTKPYRIAPNQIFTGRLSDNKVDRYRFSFGKSQSLLVKASSPKSQSSALTFLLCDQLGNIIRKQRGERGDDTRMVVQLPELKAKEFTLLVWNEGRQLTYYELALVPTELIDIKPKAIGLDEDDKAKFNLDTALLSPKGRPFARYSFELTEPTKVRIFVSSDYLDPRMELWSGSTKIAEDEDSGGGFNALLIRELVAGTFVMQIEPATLSDGEFKVRLSKVTNQAVPTPLALTLDQPLNQQKLGPDSPVFDLLDRSTAEFEQLGNVGRRCPVAMVGRPYVLYKLTGLPGQIVDIVAENSSPTAETCALLTEVGVETPSGFFSFRRAFGVPATGVEFNSKGDFVIRVSADDPSPRSFTITARSRAR